MQDTKRNLTDSTSGACAVFYTLPGGRKSPTLKSWSEPVQTPCESRLQWLGHVRRIEAGCIPKDPLYSELAEGSPPVRRLGLRFRDVCKRDLNRLSIPTTIWEDIAEDRVAWRLAVWQGLLTFEVTQTNALAKTRASRKQREVLPREPRTFVRAKCSRNCHSCIGLFSHSREWGPPGFPIPLPQFL